MRKYNLFDAADFSCLIGLMDDVAQHPEITAYER